MLLRVVFGQRPTSAHTLSYVVRMMKVDQETSQLNSSFQCKISVDAVQATRHRKKGPHIRDPRRVEYENTTLT